MFLGIKVLAFIQNFTENRLRCASGPVQHTHRVRYFYTSPHKWSGKWILFTKTLQVEGGVGGEWAGVGGDLGVCRGSAIQCHGGDLLRRM